MEVCHETIGTEHCGFRSVRSAAWAQTNKALEIVPDDALGFIPDQGPRQLHDKGADLAAKTNGKPQLEFVEGILSKDLKKGLNEKAAWWSS